MNASLVKHLKTINVIQHINRIKDNTHLWQKIKPLEHWQKEMFPQLIKFTYKKRVVNEWIISLQDWGQTKHVHFYYLNQHCSEDPTSWSKTKQKW